MTPMNHFDSYKKKKDLCLKWKVVFENASHDKIFHIYSISYI